MLIASGLRKEINGTPLFDGVALTVNRRDRVALAGQNGAGKTTLLRAIAGEVELASGELVFSKGAKVALHDQRPPLEQGLTLEPYVLSGAQELVAVEARLASSSSAMANGAHDQATLSRYAEAQARLEHAGGYMWRERITSVLRGLGFADDQLERPLTSFSGGEITRASLARALARRPRPAAPRRADEPPRRRLARVARARARRRSTPPSSSSRTTAGSSRPSAPPCSRWRDGKTDVLPGPLARLPAGDGRARARSRRRSPSGRPRSLRGSSTSSRASATGRRRGRPSRG